MALLEGIVALLIILVAAAWIIACIAIPQLLLVTIVIAVVLTISRWLLQELSYFIHRGGDIR